MKYVSPLSTTAPALPLHLTTLFLSLSLSLSPTRVSHLLTCLSRQFPSSFSRPPVAAASSLDLAHPSMDRAAPEYPQSGLPTPYPHAFTNPQSEDPPADPASAAQYPPQPEGRTSNYPAATVTPTSQAEYGGYPSSARSASFPDHVQRQYQPATTHAGSSSSGVMAQPTSASSLPRPLPLPRPLHLGVPSSSPSKSDLDVPIDPSIAASSPTYPPHGGQYSPYPPQQDLQHPYQAHAGGAMYSQPRPDWAGYGGHPQHALPGYPGTGAQTPNATAPAGARPGQVGYPVAPHPGHHQVNFLRAPQRICSLVPRLCSSCSSISLRI